MAGEESPLPTGATEERQSSVAPSYTTGKPFPAEPFCLFVWIGLMGLAAVFSHGETETVRGIGIGALCVFVAWMLSFVIRIMQR